MLLLLVAIAVALPAAVTLAVPAEWNDWLPVPRLGFVPGSGAITGPGRSAGGAVTATPGAEPSPAATPELGERPRGIGRGGGGFWTFALPRATLSGFAGQMAGLLLL